VHSFETELLSQNDNLTGVGGDQPGAAREGESDGVPAPVEFYNKRGTAEQWIKAGKEAVKLTWLSCHRFRTNEVRLWLSVIAYNPGNLWRRLGLPKRIDTWSLTSLQQRFDEDGRPAREARAVLLAVAGGRAPDTAAVRGGRAAACDAAGTRGVAARDRCGQRGR